LLPVLKSRCKHKAMLTKALTIGLVSMAIGLLGVRNLNGQETSACSQSVGFATSKWLEAKPAHRSVELIAANSVGWMGINHVSMSHEIVKRSFSSFLPWGNPQYVQVYPYAHAIATLTNRTPTLYLHIADTDDSIDKLAPGIVLAQMRSSGNERLLKVTSGYFTWNAKRNPPVADEIAVGVKVLRDDFAQISIQTPLTNGEYILLLGQGAGEGFEFRVDCK
jgi:hypothetical protein